MTSALVEDRMPVTAAVDRSATVRPVLVVGAGLAVAVGLGAVAGRSPLACLAVLAGTALAAVVWRYPAVAAYLIIGITPLVVGIDRGRVVPQMRVNEALMFFLAGVLCARACLRSCPSDRLTLRLDPTSRAIVGFVLAGSLVPILLMIARGRPVEMDDVTHAAVVWKLLAVYVIVRLTVRRQREVTVALWISLATGVVVGVIGILQSLDLLGVRGLLEPWFAPFGYSDVVHSARAGSTVGLPAATADLMVLNLVIAVGLWLRRPGLAWILAPVGLVVAVAVFSAAEFSSALGLVVAVVCVAVVLRRLDLILWSSAGLPVGLVALWPTIAPRLEDFSSMHGVPTSWLVRYYNLSTYFWPEIIDGSNIFFGVRPAARVAIEEGAFGFVWIESGYLWLLWGGGLPLFAAFLWLVWTCLKELGPSARQLSTPASVAALAAFAGLVSCVVLMIFDPHITYRGSADILFALLALAACSTRATEPGRSLRPVRYSPRPRQGERP